MITDKNLIYVKNTNGVWDVGVNTAFFFAENKKYKSNTILEGYNKDYWDFNNPMPVNDDVENILNKILDYRYKLKLRSLPSPDRKSCSKFQSSTHQHEIHFSGPKVEYSSTPINQKEFGKYVFPFSCSYKNHFWTDKPIGMLNLYVECEESDKHKFQSFMNLELVRFLCENYNKTAGFTPAIKNSLLPDLVGMNDEDAYKALCITIEERQVIQSSIK
jgi:hypothetical protein